MKWKQDFSDAELSSSNKKKEILWRVNFEEFVRQLRHKACIEYVGIQLSDRAGIVLSAILELTRSSETRLKTDKSGNNFLISMKLLDSRSFEHAISQSASEPDVTVYSLPTPTTMSRSPAHSGQEKSCPQPRWSAQSDANSPND
ncbi:DNA-directed RNA polymerase III subunit RPC3 [Forsythia ovata]|uniref:DNA-directed RNA polymerase III subunit RPC3 n=1 Tax=Forsythia ovata TaxID=205694 RepID=A0ABD1SRL6_9LAMI